MISYSDFLLLPFRCHVLGDDVQDVFLKLGDTFHDVTVDDIRDVIDAIVTSKKSSR